MGVTMTGPSSSSCLAAPFVLLLLCLVYDANSFLLSSIRRPHHRDASSSPRLRPSIVDGHPPPAAVGGDVAVGSGGGVVVPFVAAATIPSSSKYDADLFVSQLDLAGLASCHGILHASGCRHMSDVGRLTLDQMRSMGAVARDIEGMIGMSSSSKTTMTTMMDRDYYDDDDGWCDNVFSPDPTSSSSTSTLSTTVIVSDGTGRGGDDDHRPRHSADDDAGFEFEVICAENEIFKGRLFTLDQCNRLKRMSEYHAYDTSNREWRGMACKTVPGFVNATDVAFRRLLDELYTLYPGISRRERDVGGGGGGCEDDGAGGGMGGNIRFESDSEPHLVKYAGESSGSPLHVDTDHMSITINVLLSDSNDFGGGGTYIPAINRTIMLEQGQMLIHPGCLAHAGADITHGVRQILVAFVECR